MGTPNGGKSRYVRTHLQSCYKMQIVLLLSKKGALGNFIILTCEKDFSIFSSFQDFTVYIYVPI